MQPGPRQPPPNGGYPPPSGEPEYRQGPQPRTEYDQRLTPQPNTTSTARPSPNTISAARLRRNTISAARPSPDILKSRSLGPNTTSAARPNPDIRKDRSPRPNISSVPSPRLDIASSSRDTSSNRPTHPQQPYTVHRASEETTRDAQAALAARMELGPEYTEHIAEGLAERVEQLAAIRAGELRYEAEVANSTSRSDQSGRVRQFVLGIVSLTVGIPITAIAATNTDPGLLGVAVSWLGIVGVNAVHARANRPRE